MILKASVLLCVSVSWLLVFAGAEQPVVPMTVPYPPAYADCEPAPKIVVQEPVCQEPVRQKPTRPAYRAVRMRVTACSPDDPADQQYYSKYGYEGRLTRAVAADLSQLPRGTKLSIPGYFGGAWVPVDSAGGSVIRRSSRKGIMHVDVKFRTLYSARKWGSRTITVLIKED